MASIIIRYNNPYDDKIERDIVKKYFQAITDKSGSEFDIKDNDKYNGIDLSAMYKGVSYGIEVAKASNWLDNASSYDLPYCYIPARKWKHFQSALYGEDIFIYDKGIYILMSAGAAQAVFLNFKELLTIDIDDIKNTEIQLLYNEKLLMVKVPTSFIVRYVKM